MTINYESPIIDVENYVEDGPEAWEFVDLRHDQQKAYYGGLPKPLTFPKEKQEDFNYYWDNSWFPLADANTLSSILQQERPKKIIEVGSGFSTSVMQDTGVKNLICIEPYPERLMSLLDGIGIALIQDKVQNVPPALFEDVDLLFIDSSHVAKVGSDLSFLFLRILPRLKKGAMIHFHDIFYPMAYPRAWIGEGRQYNETLFLRVLLINNQSYEIVAFNSYAAKQGWVEQPNGGSIYLRKI